MRRRQKGTCQNCAQPIVFAPYAPGIEGPVWRWQHDTEPRSGSLHCAGKDSQARP